MLAWLFFILLLAAIYLILKLSSKVSNQQRQLLLLSRKNLYMKTKADNTSKKLSNLSISFENTNFKNGVTIINCKLQLYPMNQSPSLRIINKDTTLNILGVATINSKTWFEVSIKSYEKINSKGWILKEYIKPLEDLVPHP